MGQEIQEYMKKPELDSANIHGFCHARLSSIGLTNYAAMHSKIPENTSRGHELYIEELMNLVSTTMSVNRSPFTEDLDDVQITLTTNDWSHRTISLATEIYASLTYIARQQLYSSRGHWSYESQQPYSISDGESDEHLTCLTFLEYCRLFHDTVRNVTYSREFVFLIPKYDTIPSHPEEPLYDQKLDIQKRLTWLIQSKDANRAPLQQAVNLLNSPLMETHPLGTVRLLQQTLDNLGKYQSVGLRMEGLYPESEFRNTPYAHRVESLVATAIALSQYIQPDKFKTIWGALIALTPNTPKYETIIGQLEKLLPKEENSAKGTNTNARRTRILSRLYQIQQLHKLLAADATEEITVAWDYVQSIDAKGKEADAQIRLLELAFLPTKTQEAQDVPEKPPFKTRLESLLTRIQAFEELTRFSSLHLDAHYVQLLHELIERTYRNPPGLDEIENHVSTLERAMDTIISDDHVEHIRVLKTVFGIPFNESESEVYPANLSTETKHMHKDALGAILPKLTYTGTRKKD